jgi:hypothetical protein
MFGSSRSGFVDIRRYFGGKCPEWDTWIPIAFSKVALSWWRTISESAITPSQRTTTLDIAINTTKHLYTYCSDPALGKSRKCMVNGKRTYFANYPAGSHVTEVNILPRAPVLIIPLTMLDDHFHPV